MKVHVIIFSVALLIGCTLSCSSSDTAPMPTHNLQPGWHKNSLQHDGLKRVFRFYIPENMADHPPVVILLHGGTRSMDELFQKNAGGTNAWPTVAEDEGFILVVPNGTNVRTDKPVGNNQQWNDCRPTGSTADDVGFISKIINWSAEKMSINKKRVYVTGVSNGGVMAYRLASELDDKIAAIAAFIANKPKNSQCEDHPDNPVPVMIINGTADPMMPFNGGEVSKGDRGMVLSTKATVAYWAKQNGVAGTPAAIDTLQNISREDESYVIRFRYGSAKAGAPVVLYKVAGGGHLMPSVKHIVPHWIERLLGNQNNDVEGARIAWQFLSQFSK